MVEVRCDKIPDLGGIVKNPKDDDVENFLNQVAVELPKEEGTQISQTPVKVTLQGELLNVKIKISACSFSHIGSPPNSVSVG